MSDKEKSDEEFNINEVDKKSVKKLQKSKILLKF